MRAGDQVIIAIAVVGYTDVIRNGFTEVEDMTGQEYINTKTNFFKKHHLIDAFTTEMVNDSYAKTYMCADGAQWYESMRPVWKEVTFTVEDVEFTQQVKLFETEFWTSTGESGKYYEKY